MDQGFLSLPTRSLTSKMLMVFLPLVGISMLVIFVVLEYSRALEELENLEDKVQDVAAVQAGALAQPMWELDVDAVISTITKLKDDKSFHWAAVYDDSDNVVHRLEAPAPQTLFLNRRLRVERAVTFENDGKEQVIGRVEVAFHVAEIEKDLLEGLALDAVVVLILGGILVWATIHVTDRVIGRPIARLQESIQRLAAENVREPVVWDSADEIGQLVRAFNALQETQNQAEAKIREYQRGLEGLVEERTRELKDSEARIKSIFDAAPAAIYLKDLEGRYMLANKTFAEWFRDRGEDFVGKRASDFLPKDQAETIHAHDRLVIDGKDIVETEIVDEKPDGAERVRSSVRFPIIDADGNLTGTGAVDVDITERKKAENKLALAHGLITESLGYASKIQRSLLPPESVLDEFFADHFVVWDPKDIVGGDMVWFRQVEDGYIIIAADCTGHGAPGAFMTMIATGALDQALSENPKARPAAIVRRMHQIVQASLSQDGGEGESDDGLELGMCRIKPGAKKLVFAGARFALYRVDEGAVSEIKGDRSGIGYRRVPRERNFTDHDIEIRPGSQFYMWSDGLVDQVGGLKRRSFGKRRVLTVLKDYHRMKMAQQQAQIVRDFEEYHHGEARRDDLTFIGFRFD